MGRGMENEKSKYNTIYNHNVFNNKFSFTIHF